MNGLLVALAYYNKNDPNIVKLFAEKDLQLLMFDKRIKFIGMGNKITFSSAYYCYDFLPKQIIMRPLIEPKG